MAIANSETTLRKNHIAHQSLRVWLLDGTAARSIGASLAALYRASRPYSLPYAAILGALGLFSAVPRASSEQDIAAVSFGPLLWTLCVAANDYAHRVADARTRPERRKRVSLLGGWLVILGVATAALLVHVDHVSQILAAGVVAFAVGYGLAKGRPPIALALRGAAGGALVLLGASLGDAALGDRRILAVAATVTLCDLIGNLLGDVRDRRNDEIAGTATLATRSRSHAMVVVACLHVGVLLPVVCTLVPTAALRIAVVGAGILVLILVMGALPDRSVHLAYLGWKHVVVAALLITVEQQLLALVALAAIPVCWLAYRSVHARAGVSDPSLSV